MIPYFKQHLVNYEEEKKDIPESELIRDSLNHIVSSSVHSKLDRRIVKNVDFKGHDSVQILGRMEALHL